MFTPWMKVVALITVIAATGTEIYSPKKDDSDKKTIIELSIDKQTTDNRSTNSSDILISFEDSDADDSLLDSFELGQSYLENTELDEYGLNEYELLFESNEAPDYSKSRNNSHFDYSLFNQNNSIIRYKPNRSSIIDSHKSLTPQQQIPKDSDSSSNYSYHKSSNTLNSNAYRSKPTETLTFKNNRNTSAKLLQDIDETNNGEYPLSNMEDTTHLNHINTKTSLPKPKPVVIVDTHKAKTTNTSSRTTPRKFTINESEIKKLQLLYQRRLKILSKEQELEKYLTKYFPQYLDRKG